MKMLTIEIKERDGMIETSVNNLSNEEITNLEQALADALESVIYYFFEEIAEEGTYKVKKCLGVAKERYGVKK